MSYDSYNKGENKGGWKGNNSGGWKGKQGGGNNGGWKGKPKEEDNSPIILYRPYVGSGNKDLPDHLHATIKQLTSILEGNGYTLRTGGLAGTEETFEKSIVDTKYKLELILPWHNFKAKPDGEPKTSKFTYMDDKYKERLFGLTRDHHLSFDSLPNDSVRSIIARMTRAVVGHTLKSPALFVVGWSPDGAEKLADRSLKTGDFGVLISLANSLHIPVFNLQNPDAVKRLVQYLGLDTSKKAVAGQQSVQQHSEQHHNNTTDQHGGYDTSNINDDDLGELDF